MLTQQVLDLSLQLQVSPFLMEETELQRIVNRFPRMGRNFGTARSAARL